eukprot:gene12373-6041_t
MDNITFQSTSQPTYSFNFQKFGIDLDINTILKKLFKEKSYFQMGLGDEQKNVNFNFEIPKEIQPNKIFKMAIESMLESKSTEILQTMIQNYLGHMLEEEFTITSFKLKFNPTILNLSVELDSALTWASFDFDLVVEEIQLTRIDETCVTNDLSLSGKLEITLEETQISTKIKDISVTSNGFFDFTKFQIEVTDFSSSFQNYIQQTHFTFDLGMKNCPVEHTNSSFNRVSLRKVFDQITMLCRILETYTAQTQKLTVKTTALLKNLKITNFQFYIVDEGCTKSKSKTTKFNQILASSLNIDGDNKLCFKELDLGHNIKFDHFTFSYGDDKRQSFEIFCEVLYFNIKVLRNNSEVSQKFKLEGNVKATSFDYICLDASYQFWDVKNTIYFKNTKLKLSAVGGKQSKMVLDFEILNEDSIHTDVSNFNILSKKFQIEFTHKLKKGEIRVKDFQTVKPIVSFQFQCNVM